MQKSSAKTALTSLLSKIISRIHPYPPDKLEELKNDPIWDTSNDPSPDLTYEGACDMKHTDPRYGTEEHMKALWEPNKRSNIDDKADAVYKADGTLTHFTSGPRPEIPMSREEDSQFAIKTTKETAT